jgi:hypothetical protein
MDWNVGEYEGGAAAASRWALDRVDRAVADHQEHSGACHELLDRCREGRIEFSVDYDLTETACAAILKLAEPDWVCSLD